MKKEKLTHYRLYRNNTHIASVDVKAKEYEGHNLIFEIKRSYADPDEMVNGRRIKDPYFIKLCGFDKNWHVNATNRATITKLSRAWGLSWEDSEMVEKWVGMKIQLFVNPDVEHMGSKTGGIRVRPVLPVERKKPVFDESNFEKALEQNATIELIKKHYTISVEVENAYLELLNNKLKEQENETI